MELEVKDIQGKVVKKIQVPDNVFGLEMNEHVLHTVCKAYRANRRQGTHCTKTQAFVAGGGKKPFKQKGTGNARQGSSRVNTHPGGYVSHGPRPRDYREFPSKKLRQLALKVALSDKARHGKLIVVDDFGLANYSTKHVTGLLANFGGTRATLADDRNDQFLSRSTRNILGAQSVAASELNAENVLRYESLIISENGLKVLHNRFEGSKE